MLLSEAQQIASKVKEILSPFCSRIEIAGSIRRKKQTCHDIDIVCIPSNQGQFITALQSLGKINIGGQKLIRCDYQGISLDVYIATPETWATLLLIRTGSKEHNVKLCSLAKRKGMKLHADGSGLFMLTDREMMPEERIAGNTEESIFKALDLPYLKPEERN
jgi:DNA polymerase (family X)